MKKIITVLIILVVLAGGGYFVYTRLSNATSTQGMIDPATDTVAITRGELLVTISATGQVRPRQSAQIAWKTSGTVEEVLTKVGGKVKPGDELAKLAQSSLSQAIIQAESELVSAQQSLANLSTQADASRIQAMREIVTYEQAVRDAQYKLDNFTIPTNQVGLTAVEAVDQMKAVLEEARLAFEPYRNASSGDARRQALKDDLDQAQSDYNAAVRRLEIEYNLEVAQASLDKAHSDYKKWENGPDPDDVRSLEARIASIQVTLDQPHLTAPFAGTITEVQPQIGDQVNPGSLAFRIDDMTALYVDLQVSEIDVNQMAIGQPATLAFDAIRNQQYHGEVSDIALVGSQSSGVVNYTVTIKLNDADEKVHLGMTGEVTVIVAKKDDVLMVPNQAIKLENGTQVVYIFVPGQAARRVELTLGLSSDASSEVLSEGLQPGDLVLLRPVEDSTMRFFMGGSPGEGERRNAEQGPQGGQGGQP